MKLSGTHLSARLGICAALQSWHTAPQLLALAPRPGASRSLALAVSAGKGFGKTKQQPARKSDAEDEDDAPARGRKGKGRNVKLYQNSIGLIPGQQQQQSLVGGPPQQEGGFAPALLVPGQPTEDDDNFAARLAALKDQGRERAVAAAMPGGAEDVLSAVPAAFDARPPGSGSSASASNESIYDNPPPLSQTLMNAATGGADTSTISDPQLRNADIGPSQLGLAGGALVFIAVFLVVAAGDYAPASKRYSGVRPAQSPPDAIEEKILKGRVAQYEDTLKTDPSNQSATEGLASSYAKLLQYDKAAELLDKLTKSDPTNAEAWRLLGESSLLSQQPRKAVPAFERAIELRRAAAPAVNTAAGVVLQPDLQLLTGMVDAYIANTDYSKAVDSLRGIREELRSLAQQPPVQAAAAAPAAVEAPVSATASTAAADVDAAASISAVLAELPVLQAPPLTGDAPSTSGSGAEAPAPAPSASTSAPAVPLSPAAAPSSSRAGRPVDPVGVELLTAKVFSAWRGHDQDALATYDDLVKAFPEDYRGYLAKGVFLKEKGRKADAERMFLQARFFAPASKQQLVRAIADATPTAPSLPDN